MPTASLIRGALSRQSVTLGYAATESVPIETVRLRVGVHPHGGELSEVPHMPKVTR